MKTKTCAAVFSLVVCAGLALRAADATSTSPSAPAAPADTSRLSPPYPGRARIFNGADFTGWDADPSTWSIVEGAMRGVSAPRDSPTPRPTTAASASCSPRA